MSFGISVSDIWLGIQACEWLVKQCFDKNSSAGKSPQLSKVHLYPKFLKENAVDLQLDERYKQLENDVKHLESRLRSLKLALEEAIQRYEDPEHDAIDLQCDLGSLIGDFQHTLENCKEILVTHVTLKRNRAGWIQNIVWAATAQDKVDTLRRDIQFHSQKIYLVIEPVNLRLLTTIDGKVDELLDLIRTHFRAPVPLPPLPQWLDMRLRETVFDNTPTSFSELSEIPLKEGFDALYTHFRESTYAFRDAETGDQTPEQYLNLLKCQWLLEIIRQGDNFQRARQGSLYRRTIGQLERRIFDQYQRPGIVHFDERQLQNLSGTAFLIWPPEQLIQIRFPTDPDEGEQIILRLSNERENLIIFRSGPTLFRIARRFTDNFGTPYYENDRFNIHSDKFTPFYTIAKNIPASRISRHSLSFESTLRMSITRGNETGAMEYGFMEETDMFNFQRVITGYQVVFDEKKVEWALNPAKGALSPSKKIHMREGRIQIWHWNELVEERAANTAASSPTASVRRRVLNPSTGPDGNSNTESVICATTPPLPVLIIYAQDGEVYTYIHLERKYQSCLSGQRAHWLTFRHGRFSH